MKKYFIPVQKECEFCKNRDKEELLDYKNVKALQKHISYFGKIEGASRSGLCARHQRRLTREIKKARHIALLPFVIK